MGKLVEATLMSSLPTSIYRQNAIDSLNTIDDTLETLQIISPSNWLGLLASILILISIITWAAFDKISLTVDTQGIIVTKTQLEDIEKNNLNTILYQRDNVKDLYDLYSKKIKLFQKHYITRTELKKAKDDYEVAKENLIDLEKNLLIDMQQSQNKVSHSPLQALAFIDYRQAKKIKPGMQVRLTSMVDSEFNHAYFSGIVASVSSFPITRALAYTYLHNDSLVDSYFQKGTPFLLKIDLFSSNENKSQDFQPGEAIYGKIKYKTCSPLQLLSKK